MLIVCPECSLQVSDKALVCPHCGFPMKKDSQIYRKKEKKHRRLPNGFGQISEIKNRNLRKPFRVLITVGKDSTGHPICKPLRPQSYFETYNEAYLALMEYNKNPYQLDSCITMQELFEKWFAEHSKDVDPHTAQKNLREWKYISSIHGMSLSQVRTPELKLAFDTLANYDDDGNELPLPRTVKVRVKNVLNLMYDYALSNDLVPQNYARSFSLPKDEIKNAARAQKEHINYTDTEVEIIRANVDRDQAMEILYIQLYSGWRPDELLSMKLTNVNLDEQWMYGGSKTDAGIERYVPIHPKILPYIKRNYQKSKESGNEYLFSATPTKGYHNTYYTYYYYYRLFTKARDRLGLDRRHRPHDGRVYFATIAKKSNVDEYALKRMLGHRINDVTEAYYVKRDLAWLRSEILKIE